MSILLVGGIPSDKYIPLVSILRIANKLED